MAPAPPPSPERRAVETLLLDCIDAGGEVRQRLESLRHSDSVEQRRVARLLAILDAVGFLDEPDAETTGLPEQIGDYRILGLLGSGGMGVVYLAEHLQLGRRVALKVIHHDLARTQRARERFRREALLTSRLDHPGICTVYEVGQDGELPFLAMQLVAGSTLSHCIDDSRSCGARRVTLPTGDDLGAVLQFVERAALALHAAHESGLVHRDVKPGNLMVTPAGDPVLLDFGLALADTAEVSALTQSGDRLGTPTYMAPEQVAGAPADRRTDVHALGAVLYECLMLCPPYAAVHRESLFQQILREPPDDPRRRDRAIGSELWIVLQTALAKEPDRRYTTALALAEDLRRVRMHEPILARRPGPILRLRRFARRNPIGAAFVAVLLIAVVTVSALLQQLSRAFDEAAAALSTRTAVEQALRATNGSMAPVPALQTALAAVERERNVDTVSALYAAVWDSHEAVRIEHETFPTGVGTASLSYSPDGDLVLSTCRDGAARLWNREGKLQAVLRHRQSCTTAAFSPDGERVLTTSMDGTAKVWSRFGRLLFELPHGPPCDNVDTGWLDASSHCVMAGEFSPDGERIATACSDRTMRLWDAWTGEPIGPPLAVHRGPPLRLAWSRDGRRLATADCDQQFEIGLTPAAAYVFATDEAMPRLCATLEHPRAVMSVEFTPDGQSLLTSCRDGRVRIWDIEERRVIVEVALEGEAMNAELDTDGQRILAFASSGEVTLWSRTGSLLQRQFLGTAWFRAGDRIVSGAIGNGICLLNDDLEIDLSCRGHTEWSFIADLSPDGRQIASAGEDRTVRLWNVFEPDLPRFLGHSRRVSGLASLPDGTVLSVGDDGTARVWNFDGRVERMLSIDAAGFSCSTKLAPDASTFAVSHQDGSVRVYDLTGHEPTRPLSVAGRGGRGCIGEYVGGGRVAVGGGTTPGLRVQAINGASDVQWTKSKPGLIVALDFAPTRAVLAGAGWNGFLTLWRDDGEVLAEVATGDTTWIRAVEFSPDERLLATAGGDGVVRLWQFDQAGLPLPLERGELRGHDDKITSLAWSSDGSLLASGSSDGTTRLWNVAQRELIAVLRGHFRAGQPRAVNAVLFGQNDDFLLTAGDDGAIQAWPTSIDRLLEIAEERVARVFRGTPPVRRYRELCNTGELRRAAAVGEEIVDTAYVLGDGPTLHKLAEFVSEQQRTRGSADLALAEVAAAKAVELTGRQDADYLASLAMIHKLRGDYGRAVPVLEEAVALQPRPEYRTTLDDWRKLVPRAR